METIKRLLLAIAGVIAGFVVSLLLTFAASVGSSMIGFELRDWEAWLITIICVPVGAIAGWQLLEP